MMSSFPNDKPTPRGQSASGNPPARHRESQPAPEPQTPKPHRNDDDTGDDDGESTVPERPKEFSEETRRDRGQETVEREIPGPGSDLER